MLSIIGIKKTIKQHTADMDITDSVDYKISAIIKIKIGKRSVHQREVLLQISYASAA
jgi:hypothetical protein